MEYQLLTPDDEGFPECLGHIPSPPKELYVLGDPVLLSRPALSVVGTRKPTPYGRQVTELLVKEVVGKGIVIVSGLALGIDSIAHQAALDASGLTVAVLPSGIDTVYPASHRHLAQTIVARGGAVISEFPPGMPALKQNFIARNRIISGLGQALLITEAAEKSGTLHTANFGLNQGKTVLVVPGNITSPSSQGTNNLIKEGAIPVTSGADILLAMGIDEAELPRRRAIGSNVAESHILDLLAAGTTDAGALHVTSGLSASEFNQTLTMLEITGRIRSLGAGHWSLR